MVVVVMVVMVVMMVVVLPVYHLGQWGSVHHGHG